MTQSPQHPVGARQHGVGGCGHRQGRAGQVQPGSKPRPPLPSVCCVPSLPPPHIAVLGSLYSENLTRSASASWEQLGRGWGSGLEKGGRFREARVKAQALAFDARKQQKQPWPHSPGGRCGTAHLPVVFLFLRRWTLRSPHFHGRETKAGSAKLLSLEPTEMEFAQRLSQGPLEAQSPISLPHPTSSDSAIPL